MCKQSKELRLFNFQYLSVVVFSNTILLPEQTMFGRRFYYSPSKQRDFFFSLCFKTQIEADPNRWSGIKRAQNKSNAPAAETVVVAAKKKKNITANSKHEKAKQ